MSITTKAGDDGSTRLFSGEPVRKCSARPEAYGDLDELVSQLGVARSHCGPADLIAPVILSLQDDLFVAGAELATTEAGLARLKRRVDERFVAELDARRDALEASLPPPRGFVLPGANPVAAHLDLARAIARRLERRVVALHDAGELRNPSLLVWINRLSDHLWLLARKAEQGRTNWKT